MPSQRSQRDGSHRPRQAVPPQNNAVAPAHPPVAVLDEAFFARGALVVARDLLGKCLVRQMGDERISALIHETEAYIGPHDLACQRPRGTRRGPASCSARPAAGMCTSSTASTGC